MQSARAVFARAAFLVLVLFDREVTAPTSAAQTSTAKTGFPGPRRLHNAMIVKSGSRLRHWLRKSQEPALQRERCPGQNPNERNSRCPIKASNAIPTDPPPVMPTENRPPAAGSLWVAAIVAILVIAGVAAYSYRGSQTASNPPVHYFRPIHARAGRRVADFHSAGFDHPGRPGCSRRSGPCKALRQRAGWPSATHRCIIQQTARWPMFQRAEIDTDLHARLKAAGLNPLDATVQKINDVVSAYYAEKTAKSCSRSRRFSTGWRRRKAGWRPEDRIVDIIRSCSETARWGRPILVPGASDEARLWPSGNRAGTARGSRRTRSCAPSGSTAPQAQGSRLSRQGRPPRPRAVPLLAACSLHALI